jgi:hypothetical protein
MEKQGLRVASVSYDSVAILDAFAKRRNIQFPMLSDEGSRVIQDFGILNASVPKGSGTWGIPYPVTFVVDPQGKVLSKHFEPDYKERETAGSILSRQLNVRQGFSESVIDTKHLKVTASASNAVVRPNQHVMLRLDIDMKKRMHVYAPEVTGYKPIAFEITESPMYKASAPVFPKSKMLNLKAIKETVPVYEGRFAVQVPVVFASSGEMRKLMEGKQELQVAGTLVYQACDDKVCYVPQRIPLTWTMKFEPLDSERAPVEVRHKLGR